MTSVSTEDCLDNRIKALEKQLKDGTPETESFRETYQKLRELSRKFQDLLEWASEKRRDERKFKDLYRQVAGWNASDLVESLKRTGFKLKEDKALKDVFDSQGYRILELVRAGKRDEAFHAILRIFVSIKREFPSHLVEAFKPVYSDSLFKVFLFSFLSGLLGGTQDFDQ